MKSNSIFVLVFLLFCLTSCEEDQKAIGNPDKYCCDNEDQWLMGSWLLTEYGYSPGAGYITKTVSPMQQQKITFQPDGKLETTIGSLRDYKFYTLNTDTIAQRRFVIFYKERPQQQIEDTAKAYDFVFKDDHKRLTLNFRWCYEGCHLGFKSID